MDRWETNEMVNISNSLLKIANKLECYPRCTNYALLPFGIKVDEKLLTARDVIKKLENSGYKVINIGELLTRKTSTQFKIKERTEDGVGEYDTKKLQDDYPSYKANTTTSNVVNNFKRGKFLLGTSQHLMSLVNGTLYDFEEKGANRRKVNLFYQVFTSGEFNNWKKNIG